MLKRLNITGFILIIVSVLLAVLSVFCWYKSKDYLNSPERKQAANEIVELTKVYYEKKGQYEFAMYLANSAGLDSKFNSLREEVYNYAQKINEQGLILDYFDKKALANKICSIICISVSVVSLTVGIIVTIKSIKRRKKSTYEENFIKENLGEENV